MLGLNGLIKKLRCERDVMIDEEETVLPCVGFEWTILNTEKKEVVSDVVYLLISLLIFINQALK
jgi:hypothetical protein